MEERHFTLEVADFTAELALGGEWSLYDFAEFLIQTVGFDFDHAFEFCDNLDNPYRSKERYTLFADLGDDLDYDDPGVERTRVSEVFSAGRQMLFRFDYGDEWFFLVTCTAVEESTKKRRFRTVLSTAGPQPEQYPEA